MWATLVFLGQALAQVTVPQASLGEPTAASTDNLTMHFTSGVRTPGGNFSTYLHQKYKIRKARHSISFKTLHYRPNSCVASTNMLPFFANIPLALNTKLFLEARLLWPGSSSGSGGLRVPHTGRAVVTHWQGYEEWGSAARSSKRRQSAPQQGCSSPRSEQVRVCSNTGAPPAGSTLAHHSLGALSPVFGKRRNKILKSQQ